MLAQRVTATVLYNKTDISADLATFLKQLNYTDNLSGEADTLDLMLEDRAGLWQSTWFPDKGAMLDVTVNTLNWGALYGGAASLRLGQFEVDELTSSGYPSEVQIRSVSIPSNNK